MWKYVNPNPLNKNVGDCVIRAIAIAYEKTWIDAYFDIVSEGLKLFDMPSANHVWGSYLVKNGCTVEAINPLERWTIKSFSDSNQKGTYILSTGTHVVTVIDGNYYDTWDSGEEIPAFVFWKEM